MPINQMLATYSDYSFATAVAIYVLATFLYLAEQAFSRTSRRAVVRQRELVGAGAPVADSTIEPAGSTVLSGSTTDTGDGQDTRPDRAERFGRMGVSLTVLGVLLHLASIVLRGLAVQRWPLGNMYEYISFVCLVTVVAGLAMMRRFTIRRIFAMVLLPVVILMFLGGTVLYATAAPVQPALQSYWLVVHVTVISSSTGVLLLPGVASIGYLIRAANEARPGRFAKLAPRLPAKDTLDRVAYRVTIFAFPLYTVGLICGAIWAESAWGRFWGWDPKETTAFVAWVIYAAYLHARATAGWRGRPAAWINAAGFAVTVFNLFFVNLVTTGLHSYAGLN